MGTRLEGHESDMPDDTRRMSEHRHIVQSKGKSEEQLISLDAKDVNCKGILVTAILCKRVVV